MRFNLVICLYTTFITMVYTKNVKIVGGSVAEAREFPYIASFRYLDGMLFCAGAIISNKHILTAAHCFATFRPFSEVLIYTGTNKLSSRTGTISTIQHVEVYPDFTGELSEYSKIHHDLAIVTIKKCIHFNMFQNKIDLPVQDVSPGTVAVISGWGKTVYPSLNISELLQKATMIILSNSECAKAQEFNIENEQVCAFQRIGVGICDGDSGGPLVSGRKLIGIASFVTPCGTGKPDVYTRVYSYVSFIKSYINSPCIKYCC